MKLQKNYIVASSLLLLSAVSLFSQNAYVRTTTNANPWVDSGAKAGTTWVTTTSYIEILPNTQYQTIQGFGGCFQEKMWDALSHCSAAGRDSVIRALFDTSGCNFTICRMPVGANDFADGYYSLNDSAGDYDMTAFNLHHDSTKLIPLIKMAQVYKPNLRLWASPWTPPSWMKNNNYYCNTNPGNATTAAQNSMKTDATTLTAYALYLSKAVQEFKKAGISIESITCQNEPDQIDHNYPTCGWSNTQEITFYQTYMIPRFTTDNLSTRIIVGVYCCGNYSDWITPFMNNTTVKNFVNATSHSFEDNTWGPQAYAAYPTIPFYQTESNYGTLGATTQVQDWAAGSTIFNTEAPFLSTGRTSVYTHWNMVNNQKSQSGWGWAQYVMITVDTTNGKVTYNPHFYAQKHFSHYVQVGAKAVNFTTTGISNLTSAAFQNPNGDLILVMNSTNAAAVALTVKVNNMMWKATLPANSFTTLRIATGTAVQERKLENTAMPALSNVIIRNSTLYFSLSAPTCAQEADLTLNDLQGRTVWTGRLAGGSALQGSQQAFTIRSERGNLRSGTYLLSVRIKNEAGAVASVKRKVVSVN